MGIVDNEETGEEEVYEKKDLKEDDYIRLGLKKKKKQIIITKKDEKILDK